MKNNEHMGKRYVEVFESKLSEMEWVCKRMGVTSKEKDTETVVRLRGLPFGCSKEEVANFFKGKKLCLLWKRFYQYNLFVFLNFCIFTFACEIFH